MLAVCAGHRYRWKTLCKPLPLQHFCASRYLRKQMSCSTLQGETSSIGPRAVGVRIVWLVWDGEEPWSHRQCVVSAFVACQSIQNQRRKKCSSVSTFSPHDWLNFHNCDFYRKAHMACHSNPKYEILNDLPVSYCFMIRWMRTTKRSWRSTRWNAPCRVEFPRILPVCLHLYQTVLLEFVQMNINQSCLQTCGGLYSSRMVNCR